MLPFVFYVWFYFFLQDVNRRLAGRGSRRCGAGLGRAEGSWGLVAAGGGGGGMGGVKRRLEWRPI